MNEYDYLIVGAGLYGAAFAYEARKHGKKALVIEKSDHIGGHIYTAKVEGINVHRYGAHIFHTSDSMIWDFINRFASFNRFTNSPKAFYKGKLYSLPFNMNTFYELWGVIRPADAEKIIRAQIAAEHIDKPENLEEQALALVGRDVYEKLIKGYTEKQWGAKAASLPSFIIKRLPLRFTYDSNYFNDLYQGIPLGGYTQIIEKMLDGVKVITGVDFLCEREKYASLAPRIIYTGCIDGYFGYELGTLGYRSLRFEEKILDTDNFQGNAVINYTDYDVPYTRIIEHKHFENAVSAKTVVTYEYPSDWKKGDEPYYPINNKANSDLYQSYVRLAEAKAPNVVFGGRLGLYRYFDMDKVIKAVFELTEDEFGDVR